MPTNAKTSGSGNHRSLQLARARPNRTRLPWLATLSALPLVEVDDCARLMSSPFADDAGNHGAFCRFCKQIVAPKRWPPPSAATLFPNPETQDSSEEP